MGFSKFFWNHDPGWGRFRPNETVDQVLEGLECALYFVPGNHEDHEFLRHQATHFAMDARAPLACDCDYDGERDGLYRPGQFAGYQRVMQLPQGPVVTLRGGLDPKTWEPSVAVRIRAINGLDRYTRPEAWEAPRPGTTDILLSHETPKGRLRGWDASGKRDEYGSERLAELLRRLAPEWHFFGHHHWHYPEVLWPDGSSGPTHSVGMGQVFFADDHSPLAEGCFGILEARGEPSATFSWTVVEDGWLRDLRRPEMRAFL